MIQVHYPLAFGNWLVQKDTLVCRLPRKTVTVTAPGEVLASVMRLCDGRLEWKAVAQAMARRWPAKSVHGFLSHLADEGVLVEAGLARTIPRPAGRWSGSSRR